MDARLATVAPVPTPRRPSRHPSAEVEDFLSRLDHPLKQEILALDRAVRACDASIRSGLKWNSLSWATHEYFGTVFLRSTESVQVVLHFGAKGHRAVRPSIADPAGLLDWRGADRAIASLGRGAAFRRALPAFGAIVQDWVRAL